MLYQVNIISHTALMVSCLWKKFKPILKLINTCWAKGISGEFSFKLIVEYSNRILILQVSNGDVPCEAIAASRTIARWESVTFFISALTVNSPIQTANSWVQTTGITDGTAQKSCPFMNLSKFLSADYFTYSRWVILIAELKLLYPKDLSLCTCINCYHVVAAS